MTQSCNYSPAMAGRAKVEGGRITRSYVSCNLLNKFAYVTDELPGPQIRLYFAARRKPRGAFPLRIAVRRCLMHENFLGWCPNDERKGLPSVRVKKQLFESYRWRKTLLARLGVATCSVSRSLVSNAGFSAYERFDFSHIIQNFRI